LTRSFDQAALRNMLASGPMMESDGIMDELFSTLASEREAIIGPIG